MDLSEITSKFEDIQISNKDMIPKDDQNFLSKLQSQHDELVAQLIKYLTIFDNMARQENSRVFEIDDSDDYVKVSDEAEWHQKMMFSPLFSIVFLKGRIKKVRTTFIEKIFDYFINKYNLDLRKDVESFDYKSKEFSYKTVLNQILKSLDGKTLLEKGLESAIYNLHRAVYCREGVSISGDKITFPYFVHYYEYSPIHRLDYQMEGLNHLYLALNYFQFENFSMDFYLKNLFPDYDTQINFLEWFTFPNQYKFSGFKFYKNGRLDIRFRSASLAEAFFNMFELNTLKSREEMRRQ